jgi:hypothetical protein
MEKVKTPFAEVDAHPGVCNFKLWNTQNCTYWIINSEPMV